MTQRMPALLLSAVLGAVALTGCSATSGAADADGADIAGARHSTSQARAAEATDGQVRVTQLTEAEWDLAYSASVCTSAGPVTYCQDIRDVGGHVEWKVFLSIPQTASQVQLGVQSGAVSTTATTWGVDGPHAMLTWTSPDIPAQGVLFVDVDATVGHTEYLGSAYANLVNGQYVQNQLALRGV